MNADERRARLDKLTETIVGCAFKVSNTLGVGFLEKVYENALTVELRRAGIKVQQQYGVKVAYEGVVVGDFAADLLVEGCVVVELKAVEAIEAIHRAQCLNYLRAANLSVGLVINFVPKAQADLIRADLEGFLAKFNLKLFGVIPSDKRLLTISVREIKDTLGAQLLTGGRRYGDRGYFIEPTVFDSVQDDMKIAREEIFGPVMSVISFKDLPEALRRGNQTIYGLAAAIWTRDVAKAHRLAAELKAGTVWINCYDVFDAAAPFGGFKMSGIGRELGKYALANYTEVKTVTVALNGMSPPPAEDH